LDLENVLSKTLLACGIPLHTYLIQLVCFPHPSKLSKVIWKNGPWKTLELALGKEIFVRPAIKM
jgi:hypothetical protein